MYHHKSLLQLSIWSTSLFFCSFTTFFNQSFKPHSLSTLLLLHFVTLLSLLRLSFIDHSAVCIMIAPGLALAVFAFAVAVHSQHKWEFYANEEQDGMLSFGRLDAIVSPGQVSAHVHMFQGANAVGATYDYDTIRSESTCSTLEVQDDLSNYWAPAMYHYDGVGKFSLMKGMKFNIYYQFVTYSYDANIPSGSPQRYPFPEGLTMIGGSIMQRVINYTDPRSTASIFQCKRADGNNSPYDHDIRHFQQAGLNCDQSLKATTRFPSCWDGVADNSDLVSVAQYKTTDVHNAC